MSGMLLGNIHAGFTPAGVRINNVLHFKIPTQNGHRTRVLRLLLLRSFLEQQRSHAECGEEQLGNQPKTQLPQQKRRRHQHYARPLLTPRCCCCCCCCCACCCCAGAILSRGCHRFRRRRARHCSQQRSANVASSSWTRPAHRCRPRAPTSKSRLGMIRMEPTAGVP
jgi:hypothetical protein